MFALLVQNEADRPLTHLRGKLVRCLAHRRPFLSGVRASGNPGAVHSASADDEAARWVKHKGKRAVHGFKALVGADADTALVEKVSITSANINDGKAGPEALSDNPGEVFADSAYRGSHFRDAVRAKAGSPRIFATGVWERTDQKAQIWLHQWKEPIHRVRGRSEKIFGTWRRSYGLRRMRWRGLAKAAIQVHLTAIAYNLKRTMNILSVPA